MLKDDIWNEPFDGELMCFIEIRNYIVKINYIFHSGVSRNLERKCDFSIESWNSMGKSIDRDF